jgi:hypothetical protein
MGNCKGGTALTLLCDQRWIGFGIYAIVTSLGLGHGFLRQFGERVSVRHMACRIIANFRSSATLALRGSVLPQSPARSENRCRSALD